jgi:hypothetical protein
VTLCYRIYGLNLSSDSAIPALNPLPSESFVTDVEVHFAGLPRWASRALSLPSSVVCSLPACEETRDPAFVLTSLGNGQFFHLYYSDGSRFLTDAAATRVWGAPGPSQSMEDLATYFLGPIMGYVLRKRGLTALHGSAICLDGKAIVLAGEAGAGKSTTAAALALQGFPVLCEDIAPIEERDDAFSVHPGYPRVCLWPQSVEMLTGQADRLPLITPNWEKRYLPLDGTVAAHESRQHALGAIYILAARQEDNAPRIEQQNSRELLLELVQNTYMNWLLDRGQRAQEFELLSRVVSQVPIRRVIPHRDPARLNALCELIVADALQLLAGRAGLTAAASR